MRTKCSKLPDVRIHQLSTINYNSSPYREIVILSNKRMEYGRGNGQEHGGENVRWSYV